MKIHPDQQGEIHYIGFDGTDESLAALHEKNSQTAQAHEEPDDDAPATEELVGILGFNPDDEDDIGDDEDDIGDERKSTEPGGADVESMLPFFESKDFDEDKHSRAPKGTEDGGQFVTTIPGPDVKESLSSAVGPSEKHFRSIVKSIAGNSDLQSHRTAVALKNNVSESLAKTVNDFYGTGANVSSPFFKNKPSGYIPVAAMVDQWAETANRATAAYTTQKAAELAFGAKISEWQEKLQMQEKNIRGVWCFKDIGAPKPINDLFTKADELSVGEVEKRGEIKQQAIKEAITGKAVILKSMYANTQAAFKKIGVDSVVLYRGSNQYRNKINNGRKVTVSVKSNALESWSFNPLEASNFGGVMLSVKMPVKAIVSVPGTGMGALSESEAVVHNGFFKNHRIKATAWNTYASQ